MTKTPFQGVNLGGWLVLEDWMTRRLFADTGAVNEIEFMKTSGAKEKITKHRETFITEDDFRWLKKKGIGLVRIPVGYWLFEAHDGCVPADSYLQKAMQWAEKYGINVLICLHVARGGQNTYHYSGGYKGMKWYERKEYQQETMKLLVRIAQTYRNQPALWGIELLNEPTPGRHYFQLLRFYRQAYRELRKIIRPGTYTVFHDAFNPLFWTGALWQRREYPVMMDVHWYALPTPTWLSFGTYLKLSSFVRKAALPLLRLGQPVVVGEWSTVLPQRYFDAVRQSEHMRLLRKNADMQRHAYRYADGWIYWSYKVEGEGMWNFRSLVENEYLKLT